MLKVKFEFEKSTENTVRYKEVSAQLDDKGISGDAIGTLYVQKTALFQMVKPSNSPSSSSFEKVLPKELIVTVEMA